MIKNDYTIIGVMLAFLAGVWGIMRWVGAAIVGVKLKEHQLDPDAHAGYVSYNHCSHEIERIQRETRHDIAEIKEKLTKIQVDIAAIRNGDR